MSDTPETDKAVIESKGQWSFVLKETCQRLELERDQWRECADRLVSSSGWSDEWPEAVKLYRKLKGVGI